MQTPRPWPGDTKRIRTEDATVSSNGLDSSGLGERSSGSEPTPYSKPAVARGAEDCSWAGRDFVVERQSSG